MKKTLIILLFTLILVVSSMLVYHTVTREPITYQHTDVDIDPSESVYSDINDFVLDENEEIEIGEMI